MSSVAVPYLPLPHRHMQTARAVARVAAPTARPQASPERTAEPEPEPEAEGEAIKQAGEQAGTMRTESRLSRNPTEPLNSVVAASDCLTSALTPVALRPPLYVARCIGVAKP